MKRNAYQKLLAVKRAVEDGPIQGLTIGDIAKKIDEERPTVARIVQELLEEDILEEHTFGVRGAVFYVPGGRAYLGAYLQQLRQRAGEAERTATAIHGLMTAVLGVVEEKEKGKE